MAAQICETCKKKGARCYCAPNSTCGAYEPEATEPNNLKAHLIHIRRMVQSMYIPDLMNVSDGALREARIQKNEIYKHISYLVQEVGREVEE